MVLLLAEEGDPSAALVQGWLRHKGAECVAFDPGEFPARASFSITYSGGGLERQFLRSGKESIDLRSVGSVWYWHVSRSKAHENTRETAMRQWVEREARTFEDGLWLSLDCFWVSSPPRITDAECKPYQLKLAAQLGFCVPRTLMTNDPSEFLSFYEECGGSVISKPILYEHISRGAETLQVYASLVRRCDLGRARSVSYAPVMFQEYIPKKVELRVTVVGTRVFAAEIHSQRSPRSRVDWRRYDFEHTPYRIQQLPDEVADRCVRLVKTLGLQFGAIDMILTPDDVYVFLELNPVGQWGWVEYLTGLPISEAIADLLISGRGINR